MSEINDGGTAFPCGLETGHMAPLHNGMTLRDYFAEHASEEDIKAQAEVIRSSSTLGILPDGWRVVARYMHADAMLAARGRSNDGCGACGDGCRERGSCRVKDESPELPTDNESLTEIRKQRDELLSAAEAIEIDAEECLDFDECTAILVPIDAYHKLIEAIASINEK